MSYQTRSDTFGCFYFDSLEDAYKAWKQDQTIWKISFKDESGVDHRWIHLNGMWHDQPLDIDFLEKKLASGIPHEDIDFPIKESLNDNDFRMKYKIK
jgi:hypothetical protein